LGWVSPFQTAQAFSELYAQTHLPVYRYVYGLVAGHREEAEDVTAETFLRAWDHRASFDGERGAALNWLLGIARHLVIDGYRHDPASGQAPLDEASLAAPGATVEEQVFLNSEERTLMTALERLPVDQRELIVLRYLLGWRVKDMAAYLELKENTVSVRLQRTLARLRQTWPQQE
jgi:RNA polymerase sigma-70 factor (ECF subfamily)